VGAASVAEGFQQQLAGLVGADYPLGSWLPTMTADVPELLLHHQAWQQQQQQQQKSHQQATPCHAPVSWPQSRWRGSYGQAASWQGRAGAAHQQHQA
jgi:hypothetical protein